MAPALGVTNVGDGSNATHLLRAVSLHHWYDSLDECVIYVTVTTLTGLCSLAGCVCSVVHARTNAHTHERTTPAMRSMRRPELCSVLDLSAQRQIVTSSDADATADLELDEESRQSISSLDGEDEIFVLYSRPGRRFVHGPQHTICHVFTCFNYERTLRVSAFLRRWWFVLHAVAFILALLSMFAMMGWLPYSNLWAVASFLPTLEHIRVLSRCNIHVVKLLFSSPMENFGTHRRLPCLGHFTKGTHLTRRILDALSSCHACLHLRWHLVS